MPMFAYQCQSCNAKSLFFGQSASTEAGMKRVCPICKKETLTHRQGAPSTTTLETIDNGVMARPVVRRLNVIERYKENKADPKKE